MTFLRRFSPRPEPAEQDAASAAREPVEEEWKPDLIRISRLRDKKEVELVGRLHAKIAARIGREISTAAPEMIRTTVAEILPLTLDEEHLALNLVDKLRIRDAIWAEIAGYGPIQELVEDDTTSEIMVNGADQVWVERDGRLYLTDIVFGNDEHVMRVIDRIIAPLGRRLDESSPMVDARLPDGSRVNAIIPPVSLQGPVMTIRKFRKEPLSAAELVANESITAEAMEFLKSCVLGRVNMVIAGGSGAGKTTLLNVLSSFISPNERIVTIEDAAELRLQQAHIVSLETRPPNIEGEGRVTMRDILRNALRMRPDRIIVGECRGAEALDMLQAMNTGHDGSMTTIHANSPRDALSRIETMVLLSGVEIPLRAIREQMAAALDLVVHVERLQDGSRRVSQISEAQGIQNDILTMQDIFVFHAEGVDDSRIVGQLRPTGIRPAFSTRLLERGLEQPARWFGYRRET